MPTHQLVDIYVGANLQGKSTTVNCERYGGYQNCNIYKLTWDLDNNSFVDVDMLTYRPISGGPVYLPAVLGPHILRRTATSGGAKGFAINPSETLLSFANTVDGLTVVDLPPTTAAVVAPFADDSTWISDEKIVFASRDWMAHDVKENYGGVNNRWADFSEATVRNPSSGGLAVRNRTRIFGQNTTVPGRGCNFNDPFAGMTGSTTKLAGHSDIYHPQPRISPGPAGWWPTTNADYTCDWLQNANVECGTWNPGPDDVETKRVIPFVVDLAASTGALWADPLLEGTAWWRLDLDGAGLVGCAHPAFSPGGDTVICTEQGACNCEVDDCCSDPVCPECIGSSGTGPTRRSCTGPACGRCDPCQSASPCEPTDDYADPSSPTGTEIIEHVHRVFGIELPTPTADVYQSVGHGTIPTNPLFVHWDVDDLDRIDSFWPAATRGDVPCDRYYTKQASFCGDDDLIVANVYCANERATANSFARVMLIDITKPRHAIYYDITSAIARYIRATVATPEGGIRGYTVICGSPRAHPVR